jgi:hypothetical protein
MGLEHHLPHLYSHVGGTIEVVTQTELLVVVVETGLVELGGGVTVDREVEVVEGGAEVEVDVVEEATEVEVEAEVVTVEEDTGGSKPQGSRERSSSAANKFKRPRPPHFWPELPLQDMSHSNSGAAKVPFPITTPQ